jgi:hypothetical protein
MCFQMNQLLKPIMSLVSMLGGVLVVLVAVGSSLLSRYFMLLLPYIVYDRSPLRFFFFSGLRLQDMLPPASSCDEHMCVCR